MERKIVVLGYRMVGKTSITRRFVSGKFSDKYVPTIDEYTRYEVRHRGNTYALHIVEPPGLDGLSIFPEHMTAGVDCYVLLYSVDEKRSFDEIVALNDKILAFHGTTDIPRILVGNKTDMHRQVTTEQGKSVAEKWGVPFIECSAKQSKNVSEAFFAAIDVVEKLRTPREKKCVVM
eukprot:TRINITY_DN1386_c0_g1_i1.p2 TRINITY_DN1386_c0_g1~~TRINITY_DN1386_c0_g1_i1.p2  ORF type:complete len:176 (+),score=40.06 TRINITY_DN1386_c0_g1_i1:341-868(+)